LFYVFEFHIQTLFVIASESSPASFMGKTNYLSSN